MVPKRYYNILPMDNRIVFYCIRIMDISCQGWDDNDLGINLIDIYHCNNCNNICHHCGYTYRHNLFYIEMVEK